MANCGVKKSDLIGTLLVRAGIETNPGPKSTAAKKAQRQRRSARVKAGVEPPKAVRKALSNALVPVGGRGVYQPYPGNQIYQGRGGYFDWLKYIPRALGGGWGLLNGGLGGAKSGWEEGANISRAIGLGAYQKVPSGIKGIKATPVPYMHSTGEEFNLQRIEYLGDVITSGTAGAFSNTTFNFNPGVFLNWGSYLASLFEEWQFNGAVVSFRSRSSSYSSTTTLGTVMIAMNYNAAAASFTTKQQFQETSGVAVSSIDRDCDCFIEADKSKNPLSTMYVRTGALSSGQDIHLYDLGLLQIATQGCAASANIGEAYISYDITFKKPVVNFGSMISTAHYVLNSASATNPFGTSVTKKLDTIGVQFSSGNIFTLPAGTSGTYELTLNYIGTAAAVAFPGTSLSNGYYVTCFNGDTVNYFMSPASGVSSTNLVIQTVFTVSNPSSSLSLTMTTAGLTLPTSLTSAELFVTEVNSALTA